MTSVWPRKRLSFRISLRNLALELKVKSSFIEVTSGSMTLIKVTCSITRGNCAPFSSSVVNILSVQLGRSDGSKVSNLETSA